ncbi:hypothetical protein TEA_012194 [Camellia sinensis var. sinensis]|uniref:Rab3 GTPase-activating protein catalytic subunit n=1 Tax=Camellia sinensis var. sinensis TaxID=542762 RepID=A0A4S4EHB5_CAMSN|nr:hypothetical protein TEA_012194 [Camellia sinensis var. sinensis]
MQTIEDAATADPPPRPSVGLSHPPGKSGIYNPVWCWVEWYFYASQSSVVTVSQKVLVSGDQSEFPSSSTEQLEVADTVSGDPQILHDVDNVKMEDDSCHPETSVLRTNSETQDVVISSNLRPSDRIRKGSAGVVGMMLLKPDQNLHAPFTQDAPLMTEDMHEERLNAAEALGSSFV